MKKKLNAATRLLADWWSDLGADGQSAYIEQHPQSKKAKEARDDKEANDPKDSGEPKTSPKEEQKRDTAVDVKPTQKPLAPGKPLAEYAASKSDPNVTVDTIYKKLKPADVQEMKEKVKEAMALKASDELYATNGNYTPERKALHDKIMKTILSPEKVKAATPEAGTKPTFVVLGGRGGSGKSSFTHDEHSGKEATVNEFDSKKFLTLDADAVKGMLDPPYEGWNANQVHEESSYVFEKIMDAAQKMGLNIISDATLKSDKMGPVLEGLQGKGYDIEGHYMFLPREKAAERACGRYLKDGPQNRGRLVPPEVILGNTNNEANFDKLKSYFKRWSAYNNDVPKGSGPQLIDHSDLAKQKEAAMTKKPDYTDDDWDDDFPTPKKKPEPAKAAMSPRYTADDWENDPYLQPSVRRTEKVAAESLATLRQMGVRSSQIKSPDTRKAYVDYLKQVEKK